MPEKIVTGKVKWFNEAKGFGFIERDDTKVDIFVHFTAIQDGEQGRKNISEGDVVSFVEEIGRTGKPQAGQVRKL